MPCSHPPASGSCLLGAHPSTGSGQAPQTPCQSRLVGIWTPRTGFRDNFLVSKRAMRTFSHPPAREVHRLGDTPSMVRQAHHRLCSRPEGLVPSEPFEGGRVGCIETDTASSALRPRLVVICAAAIWRRLGRPPGIGYTLMKAHYADTRGVHGFGARDSEPLRVTPGPVNSRRTIP